MNSLTLSIINLFKEKSLILQKPYTLGFFVNQIEVGQVQLKGETNISVEIIDETETLVIEQVMIGIGRGNKPEKLYIPLHNFILAMIPDESYEDGYYLVRFPHKQPDEIILSGVTLKNNSIKPKLTLINGGK